MQPARRKMLWLGARLAITASLIAWVAMRADLRHVVEVVRDARAGWLALACVFSAVNICVGALRWRFVLAVLGVRVGARKALEINWSAQFFNTFLPSGMAGDALRSAWAAPGSDAARATASVVLDRASACLALALTVGAGLFTEAGRALPLRGPFLVAAVALGLGAGIVLVSPRRLVRFLSRLSRTRARRLTGQLARTLTGPIATTARRSRAIGPRLMAVSLALLTEALIVATGFSLARAAGVPLSWSAVLAVIPAAMVTAYVPFAISGLGVRDAVLVVLLGHVGVAAGNAWAISLLFLLVAWVVGLLGGAVFLWRGRPQVRAESRTPRPSALFGVPVVAAAVSSGRISSSQNACEKAR